MLPILANIVPIIAVDLRRICSITAPISLSLFDYSHSKNRHTAVINIKHLPQVVDFLNAWQANLPSVSTGAFGGHRFNRIKGLSISYQERIDHNHPLRRTLASGRLTHPDSNLLLYKCTQHCLSKLRLGSSEEDEIHAGELYGPIPVIPSGWFQDGLTGSDINTSVNRPVYTQEQCVEKAMREKEKGDMNWGLRDLVQARAHYKHALVWSGLHFLGDKREKTIFDPLKNSSYIAILNLLLDHSRLDTEFGLHAAAFEKAVFVQREIHAQEEKEKPLEVEFRVRHAKIYINAAHTYNQIHLAKRVACAFADKDDDIKKEYDLLIHRIAEARRQRRFIERIHKAGAALKAARKEAVRFWTKTSITPSSEENLPLDSTLLTLFASVKNEVKIHYSSLDLWKNDEHRLKFRRSDLELLWELRRETENLRRLTWLASTIDFELTKAPPRGAIIREVRKIEPMFGRFIRR